MSQPLALIDPDAIQILLFDDEIPISFVVGSGGRPVRRGTGSFVADGERVLAILHELMAAGLVIVGTHFANAPGFALIYQSPSLVVERLRQDWQASGSWRGVPFDPYWIVKTHRGIGQVESWAIAAEALPDEVVDRVSDARAAGASIEELASRPETVSQAARLGVSATELVGGVLEILTSRLERKLRETPR
jgi:hypothetical protein